MEFGHCFLYIVNGNVLFCPQHCPVRGPHLLLELIIDPALFSSRSNTKLTKLLFSPKFLINTLKLHQVYVLFILFWADYGGRGVRITSLNTSCQVMKLSCSKTWILTSTQLAFIFSDRTLCQVYDTAMQRLCTQ